MSVGLLLITHQRIGSEILQAASQTLGLCPLHTNSLEIFVEDEPETMACEARRLIEELDSGSGVLVLTDVYGSTPGNIAASAAQYRATRLVTGINLPMLLRIFNYPERSLDDLTEAALTGGRNGILQHPPKEQAG